MPKASEFGGTTVISVRPHGFGVFYHLISVVVYFCKATVCFVHSCLLGISPCVLYIPLNIPHLPSFPPMDDLASQSHRKRKTDQDDCQDSTQESEDPSIPGAPRQQCLADDWTSPTSPQVSSPLTSKRPRIDTHDATLRTSKRHPRRSPNKISPSPLNSIRHGSDIEDIGIVSTADPGPSSGSLLRERPPTLKIPPPFRPTLETKSESPIDFASSHIPPAHPLINRQTLKELELDVILRNPVIRPSCYLIVLSPFCLIYFVSILCIRTRPFVRSWSSVSPTTEPRVARRILERRLARSPNRLYLCYHRHPRQSSSDGLCLSSSFCHSHRHCLPALCRR